ncbi:MAG: hypothetical protein ABIV51_14550 [Saprospiraceae bacterium]
MRSLILLLIAFGISAISCRDNKPEVPEISKLAADYVKLGLAIGQYDPDFVDAYYGPDSLQPTDPKAALFPKDKFLLKVAFLQSALQSLTTDPNADTQIRAKWLVEQLKAYSRRIRIFAGETASFDEEAQDLFGVKAPSYAMSHFDSLLGKMDKALPGKGTLAERYQKLSDRFVVPKAKLDTLFKTAIAEAAKRTKSHINLPPNESFKLEYVSDKPWSGYNWYKGNYQSLIQINTDLPILIERVIDVGCHESYPGHHVYNMMLEQHLFHEKGWIEISLYPLFSPQSLIAEGSGNYGIEVAFPGKEYVNYAKQVLLPMAGMDTTGIETYLEILALKGDLNYARNEVARALLSGKIDDQEAVLRLMKYNLSKEASAKKSVDFIRKYRSYVLCYNFGKDLVKSYVEAKGGTDDNPTQRWKVFAELLSNPVTSAQLQGR